MPYRRRSVRRSRRRSKYPYPSRLPYIRGRSYYRKYLPLDSKVYTKLRYVFAVTSDGGGNISGYASCTNPTTAVNGAGSYQEWTEFTALYDLYKVHALKVQYVPSKPNDTYTTTAFAPLYIVHDIDNTGSALASVNAAIEYSNMKVMNMYRPWKYYRKVPTTTNQQKTVGVYNTVGTPINVGAFQWYGTGYDISDNYGTMIFTMYTTFKNRR